jgi:hypothetical protein
MFCRKFLDKGVIMTSNSEPELKKSLFSGGIDFCRAKTKHTNDDDSLEDDEELDDEDDDFDDFEDDEELDDADDDFDDDDN